MMPEHFAPEWEYYTPDPEIEWLFARSALVRGDFAALDWTRADTPGATARNHGYVMGCGNPNYYGTRLAPERPTIDRQPPPRKCCRPECQVYFRPERARRRHCSQACARLTVAEILTLPARDCRTCRKPFQPRRRRQACCSHSCASSGRPRTVTDRPCENCGELFRPHRPEYRFCSVACIPRGQNGPTADRLEAFRAAWLAGTPAAVLAVRFGVNRATLTAWRRRLGLASRPRGGALAAAARYRFSKI